MKRAGTERVAPTSEAPMVGDHLALDLLNTEARSQGQIVDYWNTAEDVLRWLVRHGVASVPRHGAAAPAGLLAHARALRAQARELITKRKDGKVGDVRGLNKFLDAYLSAPHLDRDNAGHFTLTRVPRGDAIASLLGPVAEAVAQLLVEGDFALVRQCEHPDCILWFYDRTKSHKRRWCSMALCGNRYKASQFRKRIRVE
ncbi:MAG: ABATE domain-containing protein [Steroidobacteraceae bacterium]|nr:ABATE domain-containing protein [Steroidobacteraceae bacterium]